MGFIHLEEEQSCHYQKDWLDNSFIKDEWLANDLQRLPNI